MAFSIISLFNKLIDFDSHGIVIFVIICAGNFFRETLARRHYPLSVRRNHLLNALYIATIATLEKLLLFTPTAAVLRW